MRCGFCHNPETWTNKGTEIELQPLVDKILRYRPYLKSGGVTLSGGEPFLQAEFCTQLATALHSHGLHVIVETNGLIVDKQLIDACDGVRLDIKNQDGKVDDRVYEFLNYCNQTGKQVTMTNVIVPALNDSQNKLEVLRQIKQKYNCITEMKLLAFRKLCTSKYERLGIPFPYDKYEEGTRTVLDKAYQYLNK